MVEDNEETGVNRPSARHEEDKEREADDPGKDEGTKGKRMELKEEPWYRVPFDDVPVEFPCQ